jgi:hypothetical protein
VRRSKRQGANEPFILRHPRLLERGLDLTLTAAMKKPAKQSAKPVTWAVYLMKAKPQWVGSVEARDEQEAMDKAMRDLNIREADRFRVSVRRE